MKMNIRKNKIAKNKIVKNIISRNKETSARVRAKEDGKRVKRKDGWIFAAAILMLLGTLAFGGTSAVMALSSAGNTGGFSLAGLLTSYRMFYGAGELTGGNGTTYSGNVTDASGAVVDSDTAAGYFSTAEDVDYNVKYAVSIYGINHDTYLDAGGNTQTAGLTFGPAAGADYTGSYKAHLTEAQFLSGNSGVCLHWMTWEEIIIQCEVDPTAFANCLANGCTHSVELVLNDKILNTSYAGSMDSGDGAGVLYRSIQRDYGAWNISGSNTVLCNVWPGSFIRATLNGTDSYTESEYAGTDTLSASECLFTCFPQVLKDAIVAKQVKSNTLYNSTSASDIEITSDKLWLFSYREILGYSGTISLRYEGEQYEKWSGSINIAEEITTGTSGYSSLILYGEDNSSYSWWLRSPSTKYSNFAYLIDAGGRSSAYSCLVGTQGLAPGFCLP